MSELTRSGGKQKSVSRRYRHIALAGAMVSGTSIAAPPALNQLPIGGVVSVGAASIHTTGSTMNINQTSQRLSINWTGFDIGSNGTLTFIQPSASAVALNRINGESPSQIYGNLNANGQVYLINAAGIYFSPSANVNVGGIVATTHQMSDADFINASTTFSRQNATGSVINDGSIKSSIGGYIALLAPEVQNHGILFAQQGTVALAGGEAITLNFGALSRLDSLTITPSLLKTLVENRHIVLAPDGLVILSARAMSQLTGSVINSGTIEANGITQSGGRIILEASTVITHSGAISANAAANSDGNGGTISIIADLNNPDSVTAINGSINTQGGSLGGNGGNIETSASRVSIGNDTRINTRATQGKFGTWTIDPTDFTIAASGGDITGTNVSTNLSTTNVTISSANGSAGTAGDIHVNDAITWSSNASLILNAQNNININSAITANEASAHLALQYGQGAVKAGNLADYFVNAPINLQTGNNFSTQLGSDGIAINYTVINTLGSPNSTTGTDLQGINGALGSNFALGSNIDAAATSGWNGGAGFTPIGALTTPFTGKFNGLGHTLSNLTINLPTAPNTGLFGVTSGPSLIENIGLIGGSVTGAAGTGGLVGNNDAGIIRNSFNTGSVAGDAGTGGLVGSNITGTLINNYATGSIKGAAGTGGLLGSGTSGSVSNSYATGVVDGTANQNLVGIGSAGVGGLIGSMTSGNISNSHATGNVFGAAGSGGLVGSITSGTIDRSYATGNVFGAAGSGGLAGSSDGIISNSYAQGNVTGAAGTGALVGGGSSGIAGSANIINSVGLGLANGIAANNTFAGATAITVTTTNMSKTYDGLLYTGGYNVSFSAPVESALGTLIFTGSSQSAINAGSYSITSSGLISSQKYTFSFVDGNLAITKAHLTVTANDATKIYGDTNPLLSSTVTGFVNGQVLATSGVTGAAGAATTATAATDVGTAVVSANAGSLASSNYDFNNLVNGVLTISKAHLTLTANDATKIYGDTNPLLSSTVTGFVNGQVLATSGVTGAAGATTTATAATDVGTAVVNANAGSLASSNYDFSNLINGVLTISKAHLTVTGSTTTEIYNGLAQSNTFIATSIKGSDAVNGVTGLASGTNFRTTPYEDNLSLATGSGLSNYDITYTNGSLAIGAALLTVHIHDAVKIINTPNPTFTSTVSGFKGSDTLSNATNNIVNFITPATTTSPVGSYLITSTGPVPNNNNYIVSDIDGTLTVVGVSGLSNINSISYLPPSIAAQCEKHLAGIDDISKSHCL